MTFRSESQSRLLCRTFLFLHKIRSGYVTKILTASRVRYKQRRAGISIRLSRHIAAPACIFPSSLYLRVRGFLLRDDLIKREGGTSACSNQMFTDSGSLHSANNRTEWGSHHFGLSCLDHFVPFPGPFDDIVVWAIGAWMAMKGK